ncbi:hypothetical protein CRG98_025451 [Punica granatum]|uniref:Uncharacterized protein n=1 Tax=Punica granatum TaxID=22663 RepID=A0A2I0JER0_PUNGR|nr:hypothetical protein CRG98_025451 [Punica granatum]
MELRAFLEGESLERVCKRRTTQVEPYRPPSSIFIARADVEALGAEFMEKFDGAKPKLYKLGKKSNEKGNLSKIKGSPGSEKSSPSSKAKDNSS